MPTGYTNKIGDGQSFNDFVMGCARAFSPLITIRDDPSDAPIPDEFAPTQFYVNQIAKYQEDLARLRAMNSGEVAKEFDNFIAGISAENKRRRDECVVLRSRYKAMRALACSWQPPTSHHIGLRDFMIKQIDDSIVHDADGMALASDHGIEKRHRAMQEVPGGGGAAMPGAHPMGEAAAGLAGGERWKSLNSMTYGSRIRRTTPSGWRSLATW
jgi:hypothetical protein